MNRKGGKNMKKVCLFLSCCMVCLLNCVSIKALELPDVGYSKNEISNMSDDEYVKMISNFTNDSIEKGYTFYQRKQALENVGVIYEGETEVSLPSTRGGDKSSSATLYLNNSKRIGQGYCYTTVTVTAKERFTDVSSEDLLGIEWDESTYKGDYYGVSTPSDGHCTYMDGSQRNNGLVLFNLDDSYLSANGAKCFASVLIGCDGKTGHKFASKYVHTYNGRDFTWTVGGNVTYDKNGGVGGGATFQVTSIPNAKSWQLYATH